MEVEALLDPHVRGVLPWDNGGLGSSPSGTFCQDSGESGMIYSPIWHSFETKNATKNFPRMVEKIRVS